jgi:hypothetical protein
MSIEINVLTEDILMIINEVEFHAVLPSGMLDFVATFNVDAAVVTLGGAPFNTFSVPADTSLDSIDIEVPLNSISGSKGAIGRIAIYGVLS